MYVPRCFHDGGVEGGKEWGEFCFVTISLFGCICITTPRYNFMCVIHFQTHSFGYLAYRVGCLSVQFSHGIRKRERESQGKKLYKEQWKIVEDVVIFNRVCYRYEIFENGVKVKRELLGGQNDSNVCDADHCRFEV